jgi:hypothetical protein
VPIPGPLNGSCRPGPVTDRAGPCLDRAKFVPCHGPNGRPALFGHLYMAAYPGALLITTWVAASGWEAPHDSVRGHTSGSRSARQWPTVDECRPHKDSAHRRTTAKKRSIARIHKKTKSALLIFPKNKIVMLPCLFPPYLALVTTISKFHKNGLKRTMKN